MAYAPPPRRSNGCTIAIIVCIVCVVLTGIFLFAFVRAFSRLAAIKPPAHLPGEPAAGVVGTLDSGDTSKDGDQVVLARAAADMDTISDAGNADDKKQIQKLYDAGRFFIVDKGTQATMLGAGDDGWGLRLYHVRILHGDQKGKDGWIFQEWFLKPPQAPGPSAPTGGGK